MNKLKPAIRFKGFTNAWEQLKLGEVGETYSGLSGKTKSDFGHGEAKFVTYLNVFSNPITNPNITELIEIDSKQNQVKFGDVFFTTSSETPDEVGMSSVYATNSDNVYLNSFCFGYRPIEKFDIYYLAYMLRSYTIRKNIIFLAQGISRFNISKTKMMEIKISIPNLQEQQKIGSFFKSLDNLITLHQRKCDKLKEIKKYCLQNLFPKNDENFPKVRFRGFTNAWEQRKLGEIAETTIGEFVIKTKQKDSSPYPVYNGGTSYTGFYDDYNNEGNKILISARGVNAGFVNIIKTRYWAGNSCYSIDLIDKSKYNTDFTYQEIKRNQFLFIDNQQAANIPSVSKSDVENFKIVIPVFNEQQKIGSFFKSLDNLITLHQHKCDKLKEIKKYCLQKMFV